MDNLSTAYAIRRMRSASTISDLDYWFALAIERSEREQSSEVLSDNGYCLQDVYDLRAYDISR